MTTVLYMRCSKCDFISKMRTQFTACDCGNMAARIRSDSYRGHPKVGVIAIHPELAHIVSIQTTDGAVVSFKESEATLCPEVQAEMMASGRIPRDYVKKVKHEMDLNINRTINDVLNALDAGGLGAVGHQPVSSGSVNGYPTHVPHQPL